jgi:precorrin-2/cobalt-factor-2 C20-methyltransferase
MSREQAVRVMRTAAKQAADVGGGHVSGESADANPAAVTPAGAYPVGAKDTADVSMARASAERTATYPVAANPAAANPPMRLIGVGVGPGDPELVTVKAVRVLREADLVFVPVLAGAPEGPGRAEATVREHVDGANVRAVPFVLDDRGGRTESRLSAWDEAARAVVAGFGAGAASIAFATIGDPNIYSTFSYLAQTVRALIPEVVVETVPGITAMQDLAARSGVVLAEGKEVLALFPMTAGLAAYENALETFDTVVAYKGGRFLPEMLRTVEKADRLGATVFGAALGLPDEVIRPAADLDPDTVGGAPYLSTVITTAVRGERGGSL